MFTFFYGKPQAIASPSLVKESDGSITVQGLLPDGRTVRAFRLTTSELAWMVQSVKTAAPAPEKTAPAVKSAAKAAPAAPVAPVDDLDAALAHLLTLLSAGKPAGKLARKGGKA